jgi:hypothetical protein
MRGEKEGVVLELCPFPVSLLSLFCRLIGREGKLDAVAGEVGRSGQLGNEEVEKATSSAS